MSNTWFYAVQDVTCAFGPIDLKADASATGGITITPDRPIWREEAGIDGQVCRVRDSRFSGTVQVEVPVVSAAHTAMLRWVTLDAFTGQGTNLFQLTDPNTAINWTSPAYIEGPPQHAYAGDLTNAVWTLRCPFLVAVSVPGLGPRAQNLVSDALDG